MVKFIDTPLPRASSRGPSLEPIRDELRTQPGRWAEVYRFPVADRARAHSKATALRKGGVGDIQSAIRTEGDEVVVYARVVA